MRDGPHDRARRKHAPCKPQRGGHRGCERRVGRATTGATRQAPPPCRGTSAAPRACAVLAGCLRKRTDSEGAPPHPLLPHPPRKGARTARRWRGDMGGGGRGQTDAPGGETGVGRRRRKKKKERKQRTKQNNAPGEESEKTWTKTATNGGRPGRHGPARDAGEEPEQGEALHLQLNRVCGGTTAHYHAGTTCHIVLAVTQRPPLPHIEAGRRPLLKSHHRCRIFQMDHTRSSHSSGV